MKLEVLWFTYTNSSSCFFSYRIIVVYLQYFSTLLHLLFVVQYFILTIYCLQTITLTTATAAFVAGAIICFLFTFLVF